MRTSNPILRESAFENDRVSYGERAMTVQGTVNRIFVLLLLCLTTAGYTWRLVLNGSPEQAIPWIMGGCIGGLVFAIVTSFAPRAARFTAPIYALLEGLALGGISAFMESKYPGLATQAVVITFGVLLTMLALYKIGAVRATARFRAGVMAATMGIMLYYVVSLLSGMIFGFSMPLIHDGGPIGIAFTLGVAILAALNLVLDFALIEDGADGGAPQYMEWYAAFGLMVTLVWLYIEILRLLAKLKEE